MVYVTAMKVGDNASCIDFADNGTYGDLDLYDSMTNHTYTYPLRLKPGDTSTISLLIDSAGLKNGEEILSSVTFYARRHYNE